MPKGVLWRQEDIFFGALGGHPLGGAEVRQRRGASSRWRSSGDLRACPAPPFMHGAAHWMAFTALHAGGTIVIQSTPDRLDPDDIWSTIEREKVRFLTIVGDAFGRPLLDQLDEASYDLSRFRILLSGGAILTPALKEAFLERIPHLMIIDGFGASETGGQGTQITMAGAQGRPPARFKMNEDTLVLKQDLSARARRPAAPRRGWLARSGHVPLGYFKDAEKTAKTFPVVDGERYAVPGDHATRRRRRHDRRPRPRLGVDQLRRREDLPGGSREGAQAPPVGLRRGRRRHAATSASASRSPPSCRRAPARCRPSEELIEFAAQHLARYKLPRAILFVDEMVRSPSGKADYRWAKKLRARERWASS